MSAFLIRSAALALVVLGVELMAEFDGWAGGLAALPLCIGLLWLIDSEARR
jgi:hypothetical protein